MHIVGTLFAVLAVVGIVGFLLKRRRDLDEMRKMEEDEEINREYGYTQLEEFEASQDREAWRGDEHAEEPES